MCNFLTDVGGPGSGKVSHCDNYLSDHPGFVHTNANALMLMNKDTKGSHMLYVVIQIVPEKKTDLVRYRCIIILFYSS